MSGMRWEKRNRDESIRKPHARAGRVVGTTWRSEAAVLDSLRERRARLARERHQ